MMHTIKNRQNGFSLLEVLIATFVMAIGLLGLAATQTLAVKHNNNSVIRGHAISFATKIADSIRANKNGAKSYLGRINQDSNITLPACIANGEACAGLSVQEMAAFDQFSWQQELNALFPEGEIDIRLLEDSNPEEINVLLGVSLTWVEQSNKAELDAAGVDNNLRKNYRFTVRP